MPEVLEAQAQYKQVDKDAAAMRFRARAKLGQAVLAERAKGKTQPVIARELGVVVEQVRRYEAAYKEWIDKHGDEPLG